MEDVEFSKKLQELYDEDQRVRLQNSDRSEYNSVDSKNTNILYNYVRRNGFPTIERVGASSFRCAVIIAIHSRNDKRKHSYFLTELEKIDYSSFKSGYCLLKDSVLVGEGKPQIYGTQAKINKENQVELYPVEDIKNLDKRRASAGLEPIDVYLKNLQDIQDGLVKTS